MRIRSKLLINTTLILICLSVIGGIGFFYTHHVASMSLSLIELEAEPIIEINELEELAWERWLRLVVHSGISEIETMQQLEQEIAQLDKKIIEHIQKLNQMYDLNNQAEAEAHAKRLQDFENNWQAFHQVAQKVLLLSQDFTKEDALRLIVKEGLVLYNQAILDLRSTIKLHREHMEILRNEALNARQQALWSIIALTFLIAISVLFLSNRFIVRLVGPLLLLNNHLKALALGKLLDEEISYQGKDEIAEIIFSYQQLKDSVNSTIEQTNAIAAGNYDKAVELRSEQDQLGIALAEMTHQLREVTKKNQTQDWFKTGQTQLHDQMSGDLTLVDLAHNMVSFLTLYLEGQIGICYLVEQSAEGLNQTVKLKQIASYAYSRRKNMSDEFEFSEGLIERAAKSQETVRITIDTGLGEDMPRHLLMIPFLHENIVKGVIILGTLEKLTDIQLDFINQVMTSVGIAVNSVESRTKMQELLQKTQNQAQELQVQKDQLQTKTAELQNQKEELQSQSEELQSQTEELQTQQEELRQINEELEARTRELQQQKDDVRRKNQALEKSQHAIQAKAEELELASKYKSEFLANMSHELRTPLNSLLILAHLLIENKDGNLIDKQIEYAKTIHSAGSDLLTLINDILDLSKVEAGKMDVNIDDVELTELVDMIKHKFHHIAEEKGLAFQIILAEDVPSALKTDVQRLQQILNNLLSNAFKFTSEGEIKLTVQRPTMPPLPLGEGWGEGQPPLGEDRSEGQPPLPLGEGWGEGQPPLGEDRSEGQPPLPLGEGRGEGQPFIAISVTDTGIGIPKDRQKVIFEAFQQVDGTTSRAYGGTGLGLSIARQLARLLGGEVQLHSEENKGSTFTLFLPENFEKPSNVQTSKSSDSLKLKNSKIQATKISTSSLTDETESTQEIPAMTDDRENWQANDKSLLIIEDDRKFSNILLELAREKGFKCLIAEDGQTGLQFAEQYKPHAIILDVGLPQIDGWTVMERLKDNPEIRHIPVHFMSASDQVQEAKKMGAIGYLLKPVGMTELGDAFKQIEQFITKTVKNVLVITDHDQHEQKIVNLLENQEIEITLATTIVSALAYLRKTQFDCTILDMDIEQKTGSQLLEQSRKEKNLCQTPLIIYAERELTTTEEGILLQCEDNVTIKKVGSPERLLDEATLFLHQVEAELPKKQRKMLQMVHDKAAILKAKKVLIVDDDMRNVFALATALEDKDMEVVSALNGKEALTKLEQDEKIHLVLMDIMMPEMDGYQAMQAIRKQYHFRKLPIIALTAKAMKGDKAKCIEAGANDYLAKPVEIDKLISLMRVWLYR
jgi:signal transduction histidine kinase/DNA-binding response OmpR family regulator